MFSGIRPRRCGCSSPSATSDSTALPSRNGRDRLTYGPLSSGERRVWSSDKSSRIWPVQPSIGEGVRRELVEQEAPNDVLRVGDGVQGYRRYSTTTSTIMSNSTATTISVKWLS